MPLSLVRRLSPCRGQCMQSIQALTNPAQGEERPASARLELACETPGSISREQPETLEPPGSEWERLESAFGTPASISRAQQATSEAWLGVASSLPRPSLQRCLRAARPS